MLITKMDISRFMTYVLKIEEEKIREKARESKKAKIDCGAFSQLR